MTEIPKTVTRIRLKSVINECDLGSVMMNEAESNEKPVKKMVIIVAKLLGNP